MIGVRFLATERETDIDEAALAAEGVGILVKLGRFDFSIQWKSGADARLRVYTFALSDWPNITPWELSLLGQLRRYENGHGRTVAIWCERGDHRDMVRGAIGACSRVSPPPRIDQCGACARGGCETRLLAHTASIENARGILRDGWILSSERARGLSPETLSKESRNAAGDPPDFFRYAMFSWGCCTAGGRLVAERKFGRDPTERELNEDFEPGVSFYFDRETLFARPEAAFDGYHPVKILGGLPLAGTLRLAVFPEERRVKLEDAIPETLRGKCVFLKAKGAGLREWTERAYCAALAAEA